MWIESGQVALVTGAASGIGAAIARALAERGVHTVLLDVEQPALDATVASLIDSGTSAEGVVVDVRDPIALQSVADSIYAQHGRIDVLVNNAGVVTARRPVWEQSYEDLRWTCEVNYFGVVNGIRAVVPYMVEAGVGHVVTTSSLAGLSPIPGGGNGVYSATKHAVVGLAETLRVELDNAAPEVGVTVLFPGPVPTRIKDAGRNRPAEFSDSAPEPGPAPEFGLVMETVPTEVVAQQVVNAIETNRMYVCTASDVATMGLSRIARLQNDLELDV